jgi:hypothetical protein
MTTEQQLRDQLTRATADVPGAPDLERSVQRGRRRRRTRRAGLALAAVAVVGIATGGVRAVTADDEGPTVARNAPVAGAPAAATDYVPGTDQDARIADAIAELLPSLPAPDDVYPSDRHTAGPLPDADFAQAEDWQATYTAGDSTLLVITSAPSEGGMRCDDCDEQPVPGGTLYHQTFSSGDPVQWYFGVYFARPDGSVVNAFESLTAPDEATAASRRQFSDADLARVIQDQRLSFTGSD